MATKPIAERPKAVPLNHHGPGNLLGKSRFRTLAPLVDADGLIRVGGRLAEASINYDTKHPPTLPSSHTLITPFVQQTHIRNCHAGVETTLNLTRAKVWIINGRTAVKRVLGQCTACRWYRLNPSVPKMAPLPSCRLQRPLAPFAHVGMDFSGPIAVSCRRSQVKTWMCLFTRMATSAVHIEVYHSLDMTSFLSAFRRFIATRAAPTHCYSDNGTNFVAAAWALGSDKRNLDGKRISSFMVTRGISWHFNPPSAPHFGGAWERLTRSMKFAMRTTLHGQHITDEVLLTSLWRLNG
ncbi:hypothetical protein M513_08693 [Trichuris suis]|uniref:Integrase catalytic domain-containing protein n=1 Tax=Trichuris suis TaxID=68888 RepID=A0A085LZS0_9BILA|nr:hypothetical protein M513_08693 [Trichuris suis]